MVHIKYICGEPVYTGPEKRDDSVTTLEKLVFDDVNGHLKDAGFFDKEKVKNDFHRIKRWNFFKRGFYVPLFLDGLQFDAAEYLKQSLADKLSKIRSFEIKEKDALFVTFADSLLIYHVVEPEKVKYVGLLDLPVKFDNVQNDIHIIPWNNDILDRCLTQQRRFYGEDSFTIANCLIDNPGEKIAVVHHNKDYALTFNYKYSIIPVRSWPKNRLESPLIQRHRKRFLDKQC
ncbi:hypothetical protein KY330_04850 [Candidatus Woesearchaeota archaeon]|nr:hypothetical protein [Candidatus Woesearchaeota archaeon]